ncbi:hypothetical protein D9619_001802 [Psilocybe cf. subviscida]|uniref:Inhibitor I9 domain-containing protein n=1 Tax=Psilocybe cf. subviscida TaxID=2480587 RepID=A0A8H5BD31_9AGAR|nr:hypothetical protein D9619_001802 [Psilocybe cf. subviscida]
MSHPKYIVVFKDEATPQQVEQYVKDVNNNGGHVSQRYDGGILNGFAASIPDSFLSHLQSSDAVAYIELDGVVTTQ